MPLISHLPEVAVRARRRVARRLLPFVFLLYIINYIDRVNVSFANLRMSTDLGFSDRVYGFGVGMFYVSYVLFEIPGALLVERWSASKWIARIMISCGFITILTAFVHSARQFYAVRFLLGVAEASFLPGMIVYLTHWFCVRDRSRAIAGLFAALPTAYLVGSPLAGWLLGVHWWSLAGWRWLFIVEGIPALVFGVITLYYMTDWPSQADWLPDREREWLVNQLQLELQAKKNTRDYTIIEAFRDNRMLQLVAVYFLAILGALSNVYWVPIFLKRVSGFSNGAVTSLLAVPALIGIAGTLINGWHSDRTGERRVHAAVPMIVAGLMYGVLIVAQHTLFLAISALLVGSGILYAFYPVFWSIPTMILSESAAAATLGLITTISQIGGFAGPYAIGFLNDRTHSLTAGFGFIALAYVAAGSLLLAVKIEYSPNTVKPKRKFWRSKSALTGQVNGSNV